MELGHFDRHFVKNKSLFYFCFWRSVYQNDLVENILEFFFWDTLQTTFLNEKPNPRVDAIRTILYKISTLFWFSKRAGETSSFPLIVRLWVWLDMYQYPWICLNILQNTWINCSRYAKALNTPSHFVYLTGFLKMPWILNMPGFWIWHDCVYARVTWSPKYV